VSFFVGFRFRHFIVPLVLVFNSISCIVNCLHSWVHNIVKHWRTEDQKDHEHVLVWQEWSFVKLTQHLVGTVEVRMVVRMSLDPESNMRAH